MATKKAARRRRAAKKVGAKNGAKSGAARRAKSAAKRGAKSGTKRGSKKTPARRSRQPGQGTAGPATKAIFLINMIPRVLSGEHSQDSEPHLTVNPGNPQQVV